MTTPVPPPHTPGPPPPSAAATPNQPPPPTGAPTAGPALVHIPDDSMVIARNVSKWFGDLVAVSDISFGLGPGVTALLGPNGAGKSTMLRMLCGMAAPSSGEVRILGRDPKTDPSVASDIGLAPQQEAVFEFMTALEFVAMSAEFQGVPNPTEAAGNVLRLVELEPTDTRRLPTYSKGMRQRVKLAQAIVHNPRVIFLDEPLSGLDPRQRLHMVDLFHQLGDQGRCVVVSSHVLEEVERFGSNVLVIAQGRMAAQGDFREIREMMDDRPRRISVRTDRAREVAGALVAHGVARGISLTDDVITIDTDDIRSLAAAIAPLARSADATLYEVRPLDDDLESVFRYLVGY